MFIIKVGVKHPGQTEGLTDDVVTELVKTVEARAKRIKASEVRLDLHKDGHAEE
jgi:hypothetical protein